MTKIQVFDDWKSWIHAVTGALAYFFQYSLLYLQSTNSPSGLLKKIKLLEILLNFLQDVEVLRYAVV